MKRKIVITAFSFISSLLAMEDTHTVHLTFPIPQQVGVQLYSEKIQEAFKPLKDSVEEKLKELKKTLEMVMSTLKALKIQKKDSVKKELNNLIMNLKTIKVSTGSDEEELNQLEQELRLKASKKKELKEVKEKLTSQMKEELKTVESKLRELNASNNQQYVPQKKFQMMILSLKDVKKGDLSTIHKAVIKTIKNLEENKAGTFRGFAGKIKENRFSTLRKKERKKNKETGINETGIKETGINDLNLRKPSLVRSMVFLPISQDQGHSLFEFKGNLVRNLQKFKKTRYPSIIVLGKFPKELSENSVFTGEVSNTLNNLQYKGIKKLTKSFSLGMINLYLDGKLLKQYYIPRKIYFDINPKTGDPSTPKSFNNWI